MIWPLAYNIQLDAHHFLFDLILRDLGSSNSANITNTENAISTSFVLSGFMRGESLKEQVAFGFSL